MIETVVTALGLGLAGIDPVGAVILMTAIAANFSRSKIIIVTLFVFISAVLAGTILSMTGAGIIASVKDLMPVATSSVWLLVNIIVATIILIWVVRRKLTENEPKKVKDRKPLSNSYYTVIVTGILFGAGSIFDPTFLAAISLAAQSADLLSIIIMHSVWIFTSQIMLFVLFIAFLLGKHEKLIAISRKQYQKHKPLLMNLLYLAAIAVFLLLVSDSVSYLVRDEYLINL